MSSSNCPKKFLECCYNKQANLCLWVFKLSGLKSVFVKLNFRDGLVRTVGLTVEIKLRFQICGRSVDWA